MISGIYSLAGQIIEIRSNYHEVHDLWRGYEGDGDPTITVEITSDDMKFEREKALLVARREGRPGTVSDDAVLETLAVYRKVAEAMPRYGLFLFHGSAIAVDGEAFIFTAPSGTGKSTHTALWRKYFGERAVMINDDKPMISVTESGVFVFGTPYNGKHRIGTNRSSPLTAICILERGKENTIRKIDAKEAYKTVVQQTYRPRSADALAQTLSLIDRMMKRIGFYNLACNMDIDAARVAYEGMKGINNNEA